MSRETVGRCVCFSCAEHDAEIRRNKKGKLYLFCADSCGLVQATGRGAQARLERALASAGAADESTPKIVAPEPSNAAVSRPVVAKPPVKSIPKPVPKPPAPAPAPDKKAGTIDDWF